MHRGIAALLWAAVALAQAPHREPFDAAIQAYWNAHEDARFDEAAAKREEARNLLGSMRVDTPQFGNSVRNLAQLYGNAGRSAQARAVLQEVLSRADGLGKSHPTRIALLNGLADSWQQDGNLLQALAYREQAVIAREAAPPGQSAAPIQGLVSFSRLGPVQSGNYDYQQLADLYRQLGRREALAALIVKMQTLAGNENLIASLYESQGQVDEAIKIYKKQVEQAAANPQAEPWQLTTSVQALAGLYQREQHYDEAASVLRQAIASLDASPKPQTRGLTAGLRQNLANILAQAGQTEAADQVHQQLLAESPDGTHLSVLTNYANYLGTTKRSAQGEDLLNNYLATHSNLQAPEESSLLFSLANLARMSGQTKRADEYQRAATEKQAALQTTPPGKVFIAKDLQTAQTFANRGDLDQAFHLALQAMDAAPRAIDRDQVAWQVPFIATMLVDKKAPEKADQLYQRLSGLVQSWSADTLQPLSSVQLSYVRFLMQQKQRWAEVPDAIERLRNNQIAAHGIESSGFGEVLRQQMQFERQHGSREKALAAGQDLLALEESLSGNTSEPYLHAVETLAELYEFAGDPGRGLPLRRQAVAIADLALPTDDTRRGYTRINTAFALGRQGHFDEAELLANEAVAIGQRMRPPDLFTGQVEQIRRMRTAPQPAPGAPGIDTPNGRSHWFNAQTPARPAATPAPPRPAAERKPDN